LHDPAPASIMASSSSSRAAQQGGNLTTPFRALSTARVQV
jgi:hypothetical protein